MSFRTATREETRALRDESARKGDSELFAVCDRALAGDVEAAKEVDHVVTLADALARVVPNKQPSVLRLV